MQKAALVSLFACRGFEVHRHAKPGTNQPTNPEQVTLRNTNAAREHVLTGQDATDLLDQLAQATDAGHMRRIVADAWAIKGGK